MARRGPARQPPARGGRGLLRPAQLHVVRRDERAGGGDRPAGRVPPPARARSSTPRRHPRALHRGRGHGLLQRPVPLRGPGRPRGADGAGDHRRGAEHCGARGTGSASTSRSGPGSRRGTPRSAGSATRGATTTRPSGASPTRRPACARRPSPGRSWSPERLVATCRGPAADRAGRHPPAQGLHPPGRGARRQGVRAGPGARVARTFGRSGPGVGGRGQPGCHGLGRARAGGPARRLVGGVRPDAELRQVYADVAHLADWSPWAPFATVELADAPQPDLDLPHPVSLSRRAPITCINPGFPAG